LAGFDAIEIRAYGGYFTDQFMTAAWNKRKDEYGGNLDGRLKLLMEMVQAVREGAGADYPLIVKYSPLHYFDGGRTIEEGVEIAQRLEAASVDALHVEKGSYENWWDVIPPQAIPLANQLDISEIIKKVVKIPVMGHGKLGIKPELAEQALADGKLDFVGLGRSLICDPEWANKVKEGRLQDVRPCIGCQMGCLSRIFVGKYVSCALNPEAGNEKNLQIEPASHKKSVLVIGGGPGGIETALIASHRGHDVTLVEKEPELGGALRVASIMPFKSQMKMLQDYYTLQLAKAGVNVECGKTVTLKTIEDKKPDVVVVATGANPKVLKQIPGIQGKNVFTAEQVLLDQSSLAKLGQKVVIAGGGEVGCEMALYLSEKCPDLDITIVEMLPDIVIESHPTVNWYLKHRLNELGVKILRNSKINGIHHKQIDIESDGSKSTVDTDTIILAMGYVSNNKLVKELEDNVKELYIIGDCSAPRKVLDAVWEGFEVGRTI
jgi:2-enoate reductase